MSFSFVSSVKHLRVKKRKTEFGGIPIPITMETSHESCNHPDKTLMEAVSRHEQQAFAKLVAEYRQRMIRTAFRILGNHEEAEDVAQDVFVKLWFEADRYDSRFRLSTWIYRICCNLCIDRLRRKKKMQWLSIFSSSSKNMSQTTPLIQEKRFPSSWNRTESGEDQYMAQELQQVFETITRKLSPKQKSVFVLKEIEGLSTEETSIATGLSPTQIKSNLHWAKQKLRQEFEKLYGKTL